MLLTEARTRLQIMTAYMADPALSSDEIELLLSGARRVDSLAIAPDSYADWLPSHAYALGQIVVPTVRNSHFYTVTVAGTGASTEPVWPTAAGATIANGGVTFAESGPTFWTPTWDLNSAAAEGWRWKIGKLGAGDSSMVDEKVGDIDVKGSQMKAAFDSMVKLYQSRVIQNWQLPGGLTHTLGQTVGN